MLRLPYPEEKETSWSGVRSRRGGNNASAKFWYVLIPASQFSTRYGSCPRLEPEEHGSRVNPQTSADFCGGCAARGRGPSLSCVSLCLQVTESSGGGCCWSSRVATAGCHTLGGSNNRNVLFYRPGGWTSKTKAQAGLAPPEGCEGEFAPVLSPSFWQPADGGVPVFMASLHMCVSMSKCPLSAGTPITLD